MGGRYRKLYEEKEKKGYIQVKVGMPNVWKSKSIFVYEQLHNVTVQKDEVVIFLDGNNRNFDIKNLYLIKKTMVPQLNQIRSENDTVETILEKIELIKIRNLTFDLGEKTGDTAYITHGKHTFRRSRARQNEYQLERYRAKTEEERKAFLQKICVYNKKRIEKMKENEPEKYNDWLMRKRKSSREYARRKRNEKQIEQRIGYVDSTNGTIE